MAAANTVFIINNTVGTPIAAIQPNTLNGPGGIQQTSDLSMFGLGYALWGQASDQNDYRLLENFACAQSVLNPSPVQPMGEAELGPNNGINVPLVGQLWFNTTDQVMYVNTATGWQTITLHTIVVPSGALNPTPVPGVGSLFFNTGVNQLLTSNGSVWESVAGNYLPLSGGTMTAALDMGLHQIHNLATPTSAYDAANKQYVDTVASGSGAGIFLPLTGGTMTGTLHMQSTGITLTSGSIALTTGNITVNTGTITVNTPPSSIAINANGRVINVVTTSATDAVNSTYGDARWLNKSSVSAQTITGPVTFNSTTRVLLAPVNVSDIANKAYVDLKSGIPNFTPSSPGQAVFPGGFIFKWGSFISPGAGTFSVAFIPAFPTGCLNVVFNQGGSYGNGYTSSIISVSASGFSLDWANIGGQTIYWQAIGH